MTTAAARTPIAVRIRARLSTLRGTLRLLSPRPAEQPLWPQKEHGQQHDECDHVLQDRRERDHSLLDEAKQYATRNSGKWAAQPAKHCRRKPLHADAGPYVEPCRGERRHRNACKRAEGCGKPEAHGD